VSDAIHIAAKRPFGGPLSAGEHLLWIQWRLLGARQKLRQLRLSGNGKNLKVANFFGHVTKSVNGNRRMSIRRLGEKAFLTTEQISDGLLHHCAANLRDGTRQRNIFRAGLDAILGVATLLDPAIAHERR
jgi:hypothetical protein